MLIYEHNKILHLKLKKKDYAIYEHNKILHLKLKKKGLCSFMSIIKYCI